MKVKILGILVCAVLLTTTAKTAIADEGIERFIKLTDNRQTLYLQDTRIGDICSDRMDIVLLTTSQLNGHATAKLDDASLLYDKQESVYKMWVLASTGANNYWSIYYVVSQDLLSWSVQSIQEVLYGTSSGYDADRPAQLTVLKESDANYKMWYNVYHTGSPWSNFIHYRNSSDGINWGTEQTTHNPGGNSDDVSPIALHLEGGLLDRLYYTHQEGDAPNPWLPYRMDVATDGVTESNIVQISSTWGWMQAATIIGSQNGDNHHRIWTTDNQTLLKYDSFDEGQTWTVANMCTVSTSCHYAYWIAGSFWEPCLPLIRPRGDWRYTFDEPDSCWTCLEFDDDEWQLGHAPFGNTVHETFGCPASGWCTYWPPQDTLWIRQKFWVSEPMDWYLYFGVDNEATFFLNGDSVGVAISNQFPDGWSSIPLSDSLFQIGENVVAVHLRDTNAGGLTAFDMFIGMDSVTSVDDDLDARVPFDLRLYQNYPNPFNPVTTIRYSIRYSDFVTLRIYDVKGRLVTTLVNEEKSAGDHMINWDTTNSHGQSVSSGVYFYRLKAGGKVLTKKMVLLK